MKIPPGMLSDLSARFGFFSTRSIRFIRFPRPWLLLLLGLLRAPAIQAQVVQMQDLFTYTASNIGNHAPTTGTSNWNTNNSTGSSVAATGSQANLICDSGTLGVGEATASYPFVPAANTLYTLNVTLKFNSTVGSITNLWGGFGFSTSNGGGLPGSNTAPNMYIQPQATSSSSPYASCNIGPNPLGWVTVPAADYLAPISATITWNTTTGAVFYYINNVLVPNMTGTAQLGGGGYYAFIQGLGTGSAVSVQNITLSAVALQPYRMQDVFTYSASNIAGYTPTTGTGTWTTDNSTGSSVAASGSQANLICDSGTLGVGQAGANYAFVPAANTLYSVTVTFKFNRTVGSLSNLWAGFGFSTSNAGGLSGTNTAPNMYIQPQASGSSNQIADCNIGPSTVESASVPAADYSAPITATVTWNTNNGNVSYYLNSVLQPAVTGTAALKGGVYYAFFQGLETGNAVSVQNITLAAATLQNARMLDNFSTYTASDIGGHAPDVTSVGWAAAWSTSDSSASSIAATGSQANVICDSGTLGVGEAGASYAFLPAANTFYTLRATFLFNSTVGSITNLWAGLGFSNSTQGGLASSNTAPNMYIQPQATTSSNPYASCNIGPNPLAWVTVPAADYSAPITATVTWNTSTGVALYYIDNILVPNMTGTAPMGGGMYYAFFQGLGTGRAFSVQSIALTAQALPLPVVNFDPPWENNGVTNPEFLALFDSGTGSAAWPSARSHVTYINPPCEYFGTTVSPTNSTLTTMFNYLKNNNLKLMVGFNAIVDTGSGYPGSALLETATTTAARIVLCSGSIDTLIMDEPLYYGHEYSGGALLSIAACAQNANQFIQGYQRYFPNVKVRDVEPIHVMNVADLQPWITDFPLAGNPQLGSVMNDIDWRAPLYEDVNTGVNEITGAGMPYGICADDVGIVCTSNVQSVLCDLEAIQLLNANAQVADALSIISFDDWDPYTTQIIPEASPSSLTYAINYYFASPQALEPPPLQLHRLYYGGYDYCTSNFEEYSSLLAAGWSDFGPIGGIEPFAACAIGSVPLYRYHKGSGLTIVHAYAVTAAQQATLTTDGFTYDKVEGYVFNDGGAAGGVALYCAYNPTTGDYWYNESYSVYQTLIGQGWQPGLGVSGGIECYLVPRWQY